MANVNMKSTKQEIFEAYTEIKNKLDEMNNIKDDPIIEEKKKECERILSSADDIVNLGILSDEIVSKYNNLCEAIKIKESRLKDLYDIEAETNTLVALINAHKDKTTELKNKYDELMSELDKEFDHKKAVLQAEVDELTKNKKDIIEQTREENAALKKSLELTRERENEEYEYNLSRCRKIENDRWEDEKKSREKEISERESDLALRISSVAERETELDELKQKVSEIPQLIAEAEERGKKAGKSEAEKSHVFEVRSINTRNEYEQNALNDKIARLESDLAMERELKSNIQTKLDLAYEQMRSLAAETVKSNGSIKIINSDNTNKLVNK